MSPTEDAVKNAGAGASIEIGNDRKRKSDASGANNTTIEELRDACHSVVNNGLKKQVSFKNNTSTTKDDEEIPTRLKKADSKDFACGGIGFDSDEESDEEEEEEEESDNNDNENSDEEPPENFFSALVRAGSTIVQSYGGEDDKEDSESSDEEEPEPKRLNQKSVSISQILQEYSSHFGTGDNWSQDDDDNKEESDDEGNDSDDSKSPDKKRFKKSPSIVQYVQTPQYKIPENTLKKSESYFMADGGLGIDSSAEEESDEDEPKAPEVNIIEKGNSILKFFQTPSFIGDTEDYDLADGGLGVDDSASISSDVPTGLGTLATGCAKLVRSLSGFNKIEELDAEVSSNNSDSESVENSESVSLGSAQ